MKWGVRRYQKRDGTLTAAGKKRLDKTKSKPKLEDMSDDELRTRINRLNLEKQYKVAMAKRNPDRLRRAKKLVADMAEQTVRSVVTKGIDAAVKKMLGDTAPDDKVTKYVFDDVSKVGDKELQKALKRASAENALNKIIAERKK